MAWVVGGTEAGARAVMREGFIELAVSPYNAWGTHVMRFDPGGPVALVLQDPLGRLTLVPDGRQRVLGPLLDDTLAAETLNVMTVDERWPTSESFPDARRCPVTAANWSGCGSSLYPSLAEDPVRRGAFVFSDFGGPGEETPHMEQLEVLDSKSVRLIWASEPGRIYEIWHGATLGKPLALTESNIVADGIITERVVSKPETQDAGFYRVRALTGGF